MAFAHCLRIHDRRLRLWMTRLDVTSKCERPGSWAKARLIFNVLLRGAEAPLFHGATNISARLKSCPSRSSQELSNDRWCRY